MRWRLFSQWMGSHQHKAESAQLREGHLSCSKQINVLWVCTGVSVSLRPELGGCGYGRVWSGVGVGGSKLYTWLSAFIISLDEHWSADISVSFSTNHCTMSIRWRNKLGCRAAKTHPCPFITERLPVTSSGPHSNQSSSPADNTLWKPSPWELLHMLWVVVKETWLNNGPSSLMHCLASPSLTHLFYAVFLRCENSCAI